MYLVKEQLPGGDLFVFTWEDPRTEGYTGSVEAGVALESDQPNGETNTWNDGEEAPDASLGRSPNDPKHYKVFKYERDLRAAGYQPMPGTFAVFKSWSKYNRLRLVPPAPDQTGEQDWFDYLDQLDEAAPTAACGPKSWTDPMASTATRSPPGSRGSTSRWTVQFARYGTYPRRRRPTRSDCLS